MNSAHLQPIELRPSRQLAVILGCAHLGALLVLTMLPVALWLQIGGAIVLLLSAAYTIRRHAWRRGRRAVTALHFIDREQLRVRMHDGTWHAGRVLGSSTVSAPCTVLNIRLTDHRLSLHTVIMNDSMATEDFRRLRVWLRWGPREASETADLTST
jgi:hypothetical protein